MYILVSAIFFRRVVLQSKVAMDIQLVISVASIVTHFLTKIYHFTRSINWMEDIQPTIEDIMGI